MKIVDVAEFYSELGGGVKTYIRQKLAAGAREGHDIVVIAPGPADDEEKVGRGRIRWVKAQRELLDPRYYRFRDADPIHDILDREAPDVVEASSPWHGARIVGCWPGQSLKALVLHNDPVAVYAHSFLDRFMNPDRLDRLCQLFWTRLARARAPFDTCVVAGEWLAQRLGQFGVTATAVPFGIDKTPFTPALRDKRLRRDMQRACGMQDEAATLFIAVSRHHPEKRLGVLIDAMSRIRHRRPAALFLIGDGPLRGWVNRIATQVGGIHVVGALEHWALPVFLASADVFLHAGAAETFGLVIAEATCAGLPLVLPNRGGALALADSAYAETYEAGDATACAEAALRMAARDRAVASAAAVAGGVTRVRSDTAHFRHLFAYYQSLIADRREPQLAA